MTNEKIFWRKVLPIAQQNRVAIFDYKNYFNWKIVLKTKNWLEIIKSNNDVPKGWYL